MAQLSALRCGDVVVHELTSSGLTHSLAELAFPAQWIARLMLWIFPQHHLLADTWFKRNFGELEIDVDENGAATVQGRIISVHPDRSRGRIVVERAFPQLSAGESWDASACEPIMGAESPKEFWLRLGLVVASSCIIAVVFSIVLAVVICPLCCSRSSVTSKSHQE